MNCTTQIDILETFFDRCHAIGIGQRKRELVTFCRQIFDVGMCGVGDFIFHIWRNGHILLKRNISAFAIYPAILENTVESAVVLRADEIETYASIQFQIMRINYLFVKCKYPGVEHFRFWCGYFSCVDKS